MIAMNPNDTSLERDRLRVVIATIVINVIAVSLLTFAPWSDWRTSRRIWHCSRVRIAGANPSA